MEPFHAVFTQAYIFLQYLLSCKPLGLSNTCLEQTTFRALQQDYLCDTYLVWDDVSALDLIQKVEKRWDGASGCCLVLPFLWKRFCCIADIKLMNSLPCLFSY